MYKGKQKATKTDRKQKQSLVSVPNIEEHEDDDQSLANVLNINATRRVIKQNEKGRLIAQCYNRAYRSARDNYETLKPKFYWCGMLEDAKEYASHCKQCQQNQSNLKAPATL